MITHDIDLTVAELNAILSRTLDFVPFFDYVGEKGKAAIQNRIENTKVTPEGDAWAPWKPMTEDLRNWKGNAEQGLLFDEGDLLASIRVAVDGSFEVEIGTDLPYAIKLQEGIEGKMEAREFIGWEPNDVFAFGEAAIVYLNTGKVA